MTIETCTLTCTVNPAVENIPVTFKKDGTTIGSSYTNSNGVATYTYTPTGLMNNSVFTAETSETTEYETSVSNNINISAKYKVTSINLNIPDTLNKGVNATLDTEILSNTGESTLNVTGNVKYYDNGILIGTSSNTSNSITYTPTEIGNHTFSVSREESSNYYSTTGDKEVVVLESIRVYAPLLDGTEEVVSTYGNWTIDSANHRAGGTNCAGYLAEGWDNTEEWELTYTGINGTWSGGTGVYINNNHLLFYIQTGQLYFNSNLDECLEYAQNFRVTKNTPVTLNVVKQGNTLTFTNRNTGATITITDPIIETAERLYIGTRGYDNYGTHYVQDIHVEY